MKAECLLWEKYRPKKLNNIILLPRIKKIADAGIQLNMVFYGTPGLGKTSLARIMSDGYDTLEINSSLFTSVETLRTTITNHIKTLNFDVADPNGTKVIILDEFERVSETYQDALKGYMEEYSDRARFILLTNHPEKIKELGSRIAYVNFSPRNQDEVDYLKVYYNKYLNAVVKDIKAESLINDQVVDKIVTKFFPDLRASVQMVQEIQLTGDVTMLETSTASSHFIDLYNFMLDGQCDTVKIYEYVMSTYQDNPEGAFKVLGRPFFTYLKEMYNDIVVSKGGSILRIQKSYNETLHNTIDPVVHLLAYIFDLKQVIINK